MRCIYVGKENVDLPVSAVICISHDEDFDVEQTGMKYISWNEDIDVG